ncbi:hypothetical protein AB1L88_17690 [Tautonia sp. JC769]|uniref:hypothetical protein n=1 Tax=Tautonia sp. JC769 TaxID=3232135 RepID=UPI00345AA083
MTAYSMDLRERVIAARDEGDETRPEIAERFRASSPRPSTPRGRCSLTRPARRRRWPAAMAAPRGANASTRRCRRAIGRPVTLTAAVRLDGVAGRLAFDGATDGAPFEA